MFKICYSLFNNCLWTQDVATLGTISLKYCGYISVVKIEKENEKLSPPSQIVDLLEQPEGGANALNINR